MTAESGPDESIRAGDEYALHSVCPGLLVNTQTFCSPGCSPPSISKYTRTVKGFRYSCAAAASFGLEAVVRTELEGLGIENTRVEDRRVLFDAEEADIARSTSGSARRTGCSSELSQFPASDFERCTRESAPFPGGTCWGSFPRLRSRRRPPARRLTAVPTHLQSVRKRQLSMRLRGSAVRMPGNRPRYKRCSSASRRITQRSAWTRRAPAGTSGGTAAMPGKRPCARIWRLRWCSSPAGTIPAPSSTRASAPGRSPSRPPSLPRTARLGISRHFAAEDWPLIPPSVWKEARASARDARIRTLETDIEASDRNPEMVKAAAANAKAAGVSDLVRLRTAPMESFAPKGEFGCLVCNPPYGERLAMRGKPRTWLVRWGP